MYWPDAGVHSYCRPFCCGTGAASKLSAKYFVFGNGQKSRPIWFEQLRLESWPALNQILNFYSRRERTVLEYWKNKEWLVLSTHEYNHNPPYVSTIAETGLSTWPHYLFQTTTVLNMSSYVRIGISIWQITHTIKL